MPEPSTSVAALLLSGGASRRMGHDKTGLVVNGSTIAVRTAQLLQRVTTFAIEIGPGVSGLASYIEDPQGEGPLVAIAAGCHVLRAQGHSGPALVIACDLPFVSERLLSYLIEWDSPGTVVPVVGGQSQPLCARWSSRDLDHTQERVDAGLRSLRYLDSQPDIVHLHESSWSLVATESQFADVDSPHDLHRLGLRARFKQN